MSRLTHPTKAGAKRMAVAFLSAGLASSGLLAGGLTTPVQAAPDRHRDRLRAASRVLRLEDHRQRVGALRLHASVRARVHALRSA